MGSDEKDELSSIFIGFGLNALQKFLEVVVFVKMVLLTI